MPTLTLLVARARNGAIGHRNALPWHLPEDLAHFRQTTMGRTLLMGRLTWESIGRILPGRQMVVVTTGQAPLPAGVRRASSLAQAIADNADEPELFVIGGAKLYASALPIADRIIMTEIDLSPPGDVFLPRPDPTDWVETSREPRIGADGTRFAIVRYQRRQSSD
ncbi:MAG: dihydrofolate reductase [Lautropia sp.]